MQLSQLTKELQSIAETARLLARRCDDLLGTPTQIAKPHPYTGKKRGRKPITPQQRDRNRAYIEAIFAWGSNNCLNHTELAAKLQIEKATVSFWRKDPPPCPSPRLQLRIARITGIPPISPMLEQAAE
jgi:hypothetical protein